MSQPVTEQPQQAEQPKDLPAVAGDRSAKQRLVVESNVLALDTARFEQMQRIALTMAAASIIPDHLVAHPWWDPKGKGLAPADIRALRERIGEDAFMRGFKEARERTAANCFLVVEQSFRWGMSPFAVAPETYVVGGKLGYQGKLVHAVVNELAGLQERLKFAYSGAGDDRSITITGRFRGEEKDSVDNPIELKKVRTDNQMWKKDPDQKLLYTAVIHWARRFCPEVVLGVKTIEDLEAEFIQVAPTAATAKPTTAAGALEAFASTPATAPTTVDEQASHDAERLQREADYAAEAAEAAAKEDGGSAAQKTLDTFVAGKE